MKKIEENGSGTAESSSVPRRQRRMTGLLHCLEGASANLELADQEMQPPPGKRGLWSAELLARLHLALVEVEFVKAGVESMRLDERRESVRRAQRKGRERSNARRREARKQRRLNDAAEGAQKVE